MQSPRIVSEKVWANLYWERSLVFANWGVVVRSNEIDRGKVLTQSQEVVPRSPWVRAAIAVVPLITASLIGQWATFPNLAPWYAGLAKPSFNPPNWIFAPVWTTLFILMAYSVWRIMKASGSRSDRRTALTLFFFQLVLNALWSCVFFGMHHPLAGLLDIIPQFLLILTTIVAFRRLDALAAICLVPLAAWVAFASVLNFEIWHLNT